MRTIKLTYDGFGSWPFRASTEVPGAEPERVSACGPSEEYAIRNLRRVLGELVDPQGPLDYPKTIEVDW